MKAGTNILGAYEASVNKKLGCTIISNHCESWQETDLVNQTNYCCSLASPPSTPSPSETPAVWKPLLSCLQDKKAVFARKTLGFWTAPMISPRVLGHCHTKEQCYRVCPGEHSVPFAACLWDWLGFHAGLLASLREEAVMLFSPLEPHSVKWWVPQVARDHSLEWYLNWTWIQLVCGLIREASGRDLISDKEAGET